MFIWLHYSMNINDLYIEHLAGLNLVKLREKYNLKRGYLEYHFKKLNLPVKKFNRKYKVNHTFFSIIDSELKAYLLGFFAADGSVNKDGRISICISEKDSYIINLFRESICKEKIENKIINLKGTKNRQPQLTWRINSPTIIKDLEKFGIKNKKTYLELSMKDLDFNYRIHFLRGFFDGDGHVRKNRFEAVIVSATKNILNEFIEVLDVLNIKSKITIDNKGLFRMVIYGKINLSNFFKYVFKDSTYFLNRKYLRLEEIYKLVNSEVTTSITKGEVAP